MYQQLISNNINIIATLNGNKAMTELHKHEIEFSTLCSAAIYDRSVVFDYKSNYLQYYIACFRAGLTESGKRHVSKTMMDNLIEYIVSINTDMQKNNFVIDLIGKTTGTIFEYTTLSSSIYSLIGFYQESEYLPDNMLQSIACQLEEYLEQYVNPSIIRNTVQSIEQDI